MPNLLDNEEEKPFGQIFAVSVDPVTQMRWAFRSGPTADGGWMTSAMPEGLVGQQASVPAPMQGGGQQVSKAAPDSVAQPLLEPIRHRRMQEAVGFMGERYRNPAVARLLSVVPKIEFDMQTTSAESLRRWYGTQYSVAEKDKVPGVGIPGSVYDPQRDGQAFRRLVAMVADYMSGREPASAVSADEWSRLREALMRSYQGRYVIAEINSAVRQRTAQYLDAIAEQKPQTAEEYLELAKEVYGKFLPMASPTVLQLIPEDARALSKNIRYAQEASKLREEQAQDGRGREGRSLSLVPQATYIPPDLVKFLGKVPMHDPKTGAIEYVSVNWEQYQRYLNEQQAFQSFVSGVKDPGSYIPEHLRGAYDEATAILRNPTAPIGIAGSQVTYVSNSRVQQIADEAYGLIRDRRASRLGEAIDAVIKGDPEVSRTDVMRALAMRVSEEAQRAAERRMRGIAQAAMDYDRVYGQAVDRVVEHALKDDAVLESLVYKSIKEHQAPEGVALDYVLSALGDKNAGASFAQLAISDPSTASTIMPTITSAMSRLYSSVAARVEQKINEQSNRAAKEFASLIGSKMPEAELLRLFRAADVAFPEGREMSKDELESAYWQVAHWKATRPNRTVQIGSAELEFKYEWQADVARQIAATYKEDAFDVVRYMFNYDPATRLYGGRPSEVDNAVQRVFSGNFDALFSLSDAAGVRLGLPEQRGMFKADYRELYKSVLRDANEYWQKRLEREGGSTTTATIKTPDIFSDPDMRYMYLKALRERDERMMQAMYVRALAGKDLEASIAFRKELNDWLAKSKELFGVGEDSLFVIDQSGNISLNRDAMDNVNLKDVQARLEKASKALKKAAEKYFKESPLDRDQAELEEFLARRDIFARALNAIRTATNQP